MNNKENIINHTRAKRITRIYSNTQKPNSHFSHPKISRLKASAWSRLNRVIKQARKSGYWMLRDTYANAKERIREIQTVEQYEDFISDTNRIAKQLYAAIERNQQAPYFKKI